MENNVIENIYDKKRRFFDDGKTRDYDFRITQLKKLKLAIKKHEDEILEALYKDLHKPAFEAFTSEIGIMYEEINYAIKNLKKWMRVKRFATPLALAPSKSYLYPEPLGVVLIIGPWNYPVQLLLSPLVGAISAGNCAVIKPSDQARNTSSVITKLLHEAFDEDYISAVEGPGSLVGPMLIEKFRFDHIFFTGSPNVGKKIAEMASAKLTPITLELGGKSPAIVDKDVNLDISAKRLVWGKFFNAGQTCVCPDYLLIHESIKNVFVERMIHYIKEFFGENPIDSDSYGRIINEKRFETLSKYLKEGNVIYGGQINGETLYIAPTLIDGISLDRSIMGEEIFGPILPILTFKEKEETIEIIRKNRYPLALYLFTKNRESEKFYIDRVEFGGGCINNTIIHLVSSKLPFGGVGYSGVGRYHGKYSFEVFSHQKSIVRTGLLFDPSLRYAPYSSNKLNIVRKLFR